MSEESDAMSVKHQSYLAQHQALIEIEVKASERFDHWILTLSAGALGLSVTFLEKIAPHPKSWSLWLLGASWLCMLGTLILSLVSQLTSQASMQRQRDILAEEHKGDTEEGTSINKPSQTTARLNVISMIAFAVGVLLMCSFSLVNPPKPKPTSADGKKDKTAEYTKPKETPEMKKTGKSGSQLQKTGGMVAPKNATTLPTSGQDSGRMGTVAPKNAVSPASVTTPATAPKTAKPAAGKKAK